MIAKLSPIDSAVALKSRAAAVAGKCCLDRERAGEKLFESSEHGFSGLSGVAGTLCVCVRVHREKAEPSHFLPRVQQQSAGRARSPALLKTQHVLWHSGIFFYLLFFLFSLRHMTQS